MKKRYDNIDVVKGLCCIAVVFIHYNFPDTLGDVVKTISRIGVPYFFFVSGFFMTGRDLTVYREKTIRKIRHILAMLLGSGLFYMIFCIVWNHLMDQTWTVSVQWEKITLGKVVKFFVTNDPFVYSHLWFILALLYIYLTFLCFDRVKMPKWMPIPAGLLLAGFTFLTEACTAMGLNRSVPIPHTEERIYLYNLFIFRALPFFLIGMAVRANEEKIRNKIHLGTELAIGIFILGELIALAERYFFGDTQFYVGTFLAVGVLILRSIDGRECHFPALRHLGNKLSMYVYILHIAVGKCFDLLAKYLHLYGNDVWSYSRAFLVLITSVLLAQLVYMAKSKIARKGRVTAE